MAAQCSARRSLVDMRIEHLDSVLCIERSAYGTPWTRGNFVDSLHAGCAAWCLFDEKADIVGYVVALQGAGEIHLLNLTVAGAAQHRGHARHMLDRLVAAGAAGGAGQVWLEVRASNLRARELYRRFGFVEVGLRKGYYPCAPSAGANAREDAIAMTYGLVGDHR